MITLEIEFLALSEQIGIEEPEKAWRTLSNAYEDQNRFYHNFKHIEKMWLEFNRHRHSLDWSVPVEWAIFWHDYYQGSHKPEEASAEKAISLLDHKIPEFRRRVEQLILATKHKEPPTFTDAMYLCDFDLSILAADPEEYRDYQNRVRHEYSFVPINEYRNGRVEFLQDFLDRKHIFNTKVYRERSEEQARENIKHEIEALGD